MLAFSVACVKDSGKSDKGKGEIMNLSLHLKWYDTGDTNGELDKEKGEAAVEIALFSPSEEFIASGSRMAQSLIVYDSDLNKVFEYACTGFVQALAFSPDGNSLIVGGKFNKLLVFDTRNWTMTRTIEFPAPIESARYA